MRKTIRAIAAFSALHLAMPAVAGTGWASADRPLSPNVLASPKPRPINPPAVDLSRTREGATARGTERVNSRLVHHDAPKGQGRANTRGGADAQNSTNRARTRENPPTKTDKRADFKLNVGICGRMQRDGTAPGPNRCQPAIPDEPLPSRRQLPRPVVRPRPQDVTWEQVLSETKSVLFPGLSVKVQPKGRTLVNLDTIVYTDDSKVSTNTVTLLGFPVEVEATPISYNWHFGDGSPVLTTSTPGKPYPSKEITHKYLTRGAVGIAVTTDYAARFNVAGTGWQYVDGTVPITGPATPLQVREAVPVLVDPDR
jgi:hypothetical protein